MAQALPAKAVFFDLDGTLINSLEDLADTTNDVLAGHNLPTHPVQDYRYFVGDGIHTMLQRTVPKGTDPALVDALVAQAKVEYGQYWARKTHVYAGIFTMLEQLQAKGMQLAVLSNKLQEFTTMVVQHFFPLQPFVLVKGSPEGGKAKPDPTMALAMAKELGLHPQEVLFMGDTRVDMETATAAGMVPVGVLWGFRPKEELLAYGARYLLEQPQDVLQYCGKR
ncbi:HAD family hydrolase [Desulfovibrio cuneatus]|uniref:HAD family hydrolase n=1 Tax=Desulfovibrio cuneatus TaxID=159728 RepID=UPI00041280DB|nr:HAD family hydrolase [Desulfovibrio cuneatus]